MPDPWRPRGGELVVSARTEPRTFNRLTSREATTDLVASLMHAKLIRINRVTDDVEPWLAESWTRSADGLRYTLKLRPNVSFSDGHPLSADDVVFSLEAAYAVPFSADALEIDGKKLKMSAVDPLTVVLTFPAPFAPGLRILDNLLVLPRHKLEPALEERHAGDGVGPVHAAVRARRPRAVRAERLQPGPAPGVRAQPALLAQGRRKRRGAAVSRSPHARRRSRGEHRAAAARVGPERHDDQRGAVGGVRAAQARGRRGQAAAVRSRRRATTPTRSGST